MDDLETKQPSQAFASKVVSVKDYADKNKLTVQAVYWQIKQGKIRSTKIGSYTLVYL
jgi:hypothetical protein